MRNQIVDDFMDRLQKGILPIKIPANNELHRGGFTTSILVHVARGVLFRREDPIAVILRILCIEYIALTNPKLRPKLVSFLQSNIVKMAKSRKRKSPAQQKCEELFGSWKAGELTLLEVVQ